MSQTMGQIITSARDRLDEATEIQWTDVQLRKWCNEGCKDISRRTQTLEKRATIPVVAATQEYTCPTDMVRINRVEYRRTGDSQTFPLEYRDWQNMDQVWFTSQNVTTSTPAFYTLWGSPPTLKMALYPIPAQAGTLTVFYYALSGDLATNGSADSSAIDVPAGWEDLVVDYVEFMALRRDQDPRWQEAKALYDERLGAMYDNTQRWTDQAGMISSDVSGAYVPQWIWSDA